MALDIPVGMENLYLHIPDIECARRVIKMHGGFETGTFDALEDMKLYITEAVQVSRVGSTFEMQDSEIVCDKHAKIELKDCYIEGCGQHASKFIIGTYGLCKVINCLFVNMIILVQDFDKFVHVFDDNMFKNCYMMTKIQGENNQYQGGTTGWISNDA